MFNIICHPTALGGQNTGCDADAITFRNSAGGPLVGNQYLPQAGLPLRLSSDVAQKIWIKSAAYAGAFASQQLLVSAGDIEQVGLVGYGSTNVGLAAVQAAYSDGISH